MTLEEALNILRKDDQYHYIYTYHRGGLIVSSYSLDEGLELGVYADEQDFIEQHKDLIDELGE